MTEDQIREGFWADHPELNGSDWPPEYPNGAYAREIYDAFDAYIDKLDGNGLVNGQFAAMIEL